MAMPSDVGVIDLMPAIPEGSEKERFGFLRAGPMDDESEATSFPSQ
jgi:hypothetical protein